MLDRGTSDLYILVNLVVGNVARIGRYPQLFDLPAQELERLWLFGTRPNGGRGQYESLTLPMQHQRTLRSKLDALNVSPNHAVMTGQVFVAHAIVVELKRTSGDEHVQAHQNERPEECRWSVLTREKGAEAAAKGEDHTHPGDDLVAQKTNFQRSRRRNAHMRSKARIKRPS